MQNNNSLDSRLKIVAAAYRKPHHGLLPAGMTLLFILFNYGVGYSQGQSIKAKNEIASPPAAPRNDIEKTGPYLWDFGKVKEGDVLTHGFILKNDSLNPLNIKEINTSCGCAAAKPKEKKLLAGESTVIEVKFNSKKYSGQVKQFVYVSTDNMDLPIFKFTIKAEVVK